MTTASSSNAKNQSKQESKIPTKVCRSKPGGRKTSNSSTSVPKTETNIPKPRATRNSKTSQSSVFDRLHKTSTISSRTRKVIAPVVQPNILTRDAETVALKPLTRSGKQERGTFDRLHKTSTISSRTRKVIAPVVQCNILTRDAENVAPKPLTRSRKREQSSRPVFDRLSKQGTASSKAKRTNILGSKDNVVSNKS